MHATIDVSTLAHGLMEAAAADQEALPAETAPELQFAWSCDLGAMLDVLLDRFGCPEQAKPWQSALRQISPGTITINDEAAMLQVYDLDMETARTLLAHLEERAEQLGAELVYTDVVNSEAAQARSDDGYKETAQTDGHTLWLEQDLQACGGVLKRCNDIVHFVFGHFQQWSGTGSTLLLDRDEAWAIGKPDPRLFPPRLKTLWGLYEFEGLLLSIEGLRRSLDMASLHLSKKNRDRLLQYFTDAAFVNLCFIESYIRGGSTPAEDFWSFGQPIPARQALPHLDGFLTRQPLDLGMTLNT